ncbi:MAG TPA: ABC transporter ATP-binding protein/permease [Candidatus Methylomirabilis sp.]|nr:ABC transporter ATP-binding protein/permease [Candidatus Methylomirabilis sp.]
MTSGREVASLHQVSRERIALSKLWALLRPYWFSEDRWPGRGLLVLVIGLNLASVFLTVLLATWNRQFFDALQVKDYSAFLALLGRFGLLAALYILVTVYALYFNQMLQIRWRRWLTAQYYRDWLTGRVYYLLQLEPSHVENPEQRIQDDIGLVANLSLELATGALNAAVTLGSFLVLLWTLSGTLPLHLAGLSLAIPGYMVWVAILYAALGSVGTHFVGRALIDINYDLERANADFRFRMIRIREYAESVALYGGESDEQEQLKASFGHIWRSWWRLMTTQKRLTFFTAGYGQAATVFPILVAAPRYFAGTISLGGLTQTALAFGQVQSALSWFVDAYPRIAQWTASVNRLTGFREALARAQELPTVPAAIRVVSSPVAKVVVDSLHLHLPDGRSLLDGVSLRIDAGERVVVSGLSGSGKSTLFRALAGIWPYGSGTVTLPTGRRVLFLPQRPYLPIASLREVLSYPDRPEGHPEADFRQALVDARLPHLIPRLEKEANWSLELSGGEQQRIGFARVFLYRPDWLFLDEATSALDEETEQALYGLVQERLPTITLVSVAHRPAVASFHQRRLTLHPETRTIEDAVMPATVGC